ncbi:hypothetical protein BB8028_0001g06120 [Beauveria bassiana]|uniref:Uncharacterized protein n=1 Tax=Beauveria bassiana TaxID=176275 RepID=A0A2S7XXC1_BEABA|nr:hypothetical protein BB8028_0001g06120 [Beauveria bassiana]
MLFSAPHPHCLLRFHIRRRYPRPRHITTSDLILQPLLPSAPSPLLPTLLTTTVFHSPPIIDSIQRQLVSPAPTRLALPRAGPSTAGFLFSFNPTAPSRSPDQGPYSNTPQSRSHHHASCHKKRPHRVRSLDQVHHCQH